MHTYKHGYIHAPKISVCLTSLQNPSNGSGGQGTCIPMECVQGDPPVNHGFAVEESGVEPPVSVLEMLVCLW